MLMCEIGHHNYLGDNSGNMEEEFAVGRSNKTDEKFDSIIGLVEDIIMEDKFQSLQNQFMETYYTEFEDSEENKLCYTDLHKNYTDLIEKYITQELTSRMPDFSIAEFQEQLVSRRDELDGEVFEILVTFSDFLPFKEMMLDYRADKEGRTVDLSSGFTVTSLGGANNDAMFSTGISSTGLAMSGSGLCVAGSSANHMDLMDSEEAMLEGVNTPRLDSGDSQISSAANRDSTKQDSNSDQIDAAMESPR